MSAVLPPEKSAKIGIYAHARERLFTFGRSVSLVIHWLGSARLPVLGRVDERSPSRADREIERCAGRKPANLGPSGGSGLTVPDGSGDQRR
jgi:hypothetical protein